MFERAIRNILLCELYVLRFGGHYVERELKNDIILNKEHFSIKYFYYHQDIKCSSGANAIKLFLSVIYEFS
jgi:hypothetical protein